MSELVDTFGELQDYLDNAIRKWRESRDDCAKFYIDAFQSVRVSVFGRVLE